MVLFTGNPHHISHPHTLISSQVGKDLRLYCCCVKCGLHLKVGEWLDPLPFCPHAHTGASAVRDQKGRIRAAACTLGGNYSVGNGRVFGSGGREGGMEVGTYFGRCLCVLCYNTLLSAKACLTDSARHANAVQSPRQILPI